MPTVYPTIAAAREAESVAAIGGARDRQPGGGQRRGGQGEGWCKPKKRHARPFCPTSQGPRAIPSPGKGPMGGGGPVRASGLLACWLQRS